MRKLKAIIFDMDGTILESEVLWRQAPLRLLASKGLVMPHELLMGQPGLRGYDAMRLMLDCNVPGMDMTMDEVKDWCIKDVYRLYETTITVKPGTYELLDCLKAKGIPLALVTATKEDVTLKVLDRLHLRDYFQVVHSTFAQELNKSHVALFDDICARLGAANADCALLDDSLYALRGADEAGLETWAIEELVQLPNKARIRMMADRYFTHLDQVRAMIEEEIEGTEETVLS